MKINNHQQLALLIQREWTKLHGTCMQVANYEGKIDLNFYPKIINL